MISTGIVRKIDNLGRLVLPRELRYTLNINPGDDFEIYKENELIILKKYSKLIDSKEKIIEILNCFNMNINFSMYLIVNNKIINNDEDINNNINIIMQERKVIRNIPSQMLSKSIDITLNNIMYPIVLNGDLHGMIVSIGKEDINTMENIIRIFISIIKKYM